MKGIQFVTAINSFEITAVVQPNVFKFNLEALVRMQPSEGGFLFFAST